MSKEGTARRKRPDGPRPERGIGIARFRKWPSSPRRKLSFRDWVPSSGFLFLPSFGGLMLFTGGVEGAFQGGTARYWSAPVILIGAILLACVIVYIRRPLKSSR